MLESAKNGHVIIIETGDCVEAATWGELMSYSVRGRGVLGAITDGAVRDARQIREIQPPFPVWARGYNPTDSQGRLEIEEYDNVTVRCGGVTVHPGDIVFADIDGVAIIPKEIAEEVVSASEDRLKKEEEFRQDIHQGVPISSAAAKYKVL